MLKFCYKQKRYKRNGLPEEMPDEYWEQGAKIVTCMILKNIT